MNLTLLVLSALTLVRGVVADTPLDSRCWNWQTWQSFTVYAMCWDINGHLVQTSLDIGQCVNYIDPMEGRDELDVGPWYPAPPGPAVNVPWKPLPDVCSSCGIYNNGLVCRCFVDGSKHWSNPLPLDSVFKVNDDGTLACVSPASHN